MYYVPDNLPYSGCYTFVDNNTIRIYETLPVLDVQNNFVDISVDNHYFWHQDSQIISEIPVCIDSNNFNHNWFNRVDISDVLISIFILAFLIIFPIIYGLKLLFRGWY